MRWQFMGASRRRNHPGMMPYRFRLMVTALTTSTAGFTAANLNFEMYWDDNPEKLDRFVTTLDQADYIFISSNRQWGTTVRVPERYPLTTQYYRSLVGCPAEKEIIWCYRGRGTGHVRGAVRLRSGEGRPVRS